MFICYIKQREGQKIVVGLANALILLYLWSTTFLVGQSLTKRITITKEQAEHLVNKVMDSVRPEKPENSYLPAFMKDQLTWIFTQNSRGQLTFDLDWGFNPDDRGAFLASAYVGGKPSIKIYIPRLIEEVKTWDFNNHETHVLPQQTKNFIAICLVHEAVHLEQGEGFFKLEPTPERRLQEEMRVWAIVSLNAVRPLRLKHQPVSKDFLDADYILEQQCRDIWQKCRAFILLMKSKISP